MCEIIEFRKSVKRTEKKTYLVDLSGENAKNGEICPIEVPNGYKAPEGNPDIFVYTDYESQIPEQEKRAESNEDMNEDDDLVRNYDDEVSITKEDMFLLNKRKNGIRVESFKREGESRIRNKLVGVGTSRNGTRTYQISYEFAKDIGEENLDWIKRQVLKTTNEDNKILRSFYFFNCLSCFDFETIKIRVDDFSKDDFGCPSKTNILDMYVKKGKSKHYFDVVVEGIDVIEGHRLEDLLRCRYSFGFDTKIGGDRDCGFEKFFDILKENIGFDVKFRLMNFAFSDAEQCVNTERCKRGRGLSMTPLNIDLSST